MGQVPVCRPLVQNRRSGYGLMNGQIRVATVASCPFPMIDAHAAAMLAKQGMPPRGHCPESRIVGFLSENIPISCASEN